RANFRSKPLLLSGLLLPNELVDAFDHLDRSRRQTGTAALKDDACRSDDRFQWNSFSLSCCTAFLFYPREAIEVPDVDASWVKTRLVTMAVRRSTPPAAPMQHSGGAC